MVFHGNGRSEKKVVLITSRYNVCTLLVNTLAGSGQRREGCFRDNLFSSSASSLTSLGAQGYPISPYQCARYGAYGSGPAVPRVGSAYSGHIGNVFCLIVTKLDLFSWRCASDWSTFRLHKFAHCHMS
ncbi:hypothetical protein VFPPC_18210 [Pochonia chlamydosporia 170]|uniref:Uncharacterized protein n=1 Tax=Pochonia chlamydosporia 170 TaxID=1380566 RepID=A0A219AP72_METCM|nr:hypothetical protein VFPPC_18210 [Pochonia chlamydosporia 170]OWT42650.1 hypothetical protein VFPPC_18210 [Pochonia chlamydosporia 170]